MVAFLQKVHVSQPQNTGLDSSAACNNFSKVSKGAKIRNRYNQVPHLTQDINVKVTNLQCDTTNKSQEASQVVFSLSLRLLTSLKLLILFIIYLKAYCNFYGFIFKSLAYWTVHP